MPIVVSCQCGKNLRIDDAHAGKQGKCPACSRTFQIPGVPEPEPMELPDPEPDPVAQSEAPPRLAEREPSTSAEPIANHGGQPHHPEADFFADPPAEIGPVVSAHTSLLNGLVPWSLGARAAVSLGAAFAGAVLGLIIVMAIHPRESIWYVFWPIVAGILAFIIGLICTGFSHTCSYVGSQGIAKFTCSGSRENLKGEEVFCFRDAAELRTSQTRQYHNGVYSGTNYTFTWSDVGGRKRHVITGRHKSEKGNPPSTDLFQYARAAENQWTVYLLEEAFRAIELRGTVTFNLSGGQWIKLGQGFMIVSKGGDDGEQWDAAEVGIVNVDQGIVRIKRADAKEGWFSSQGVFKFSFDSLANAQLFFHLCDKLVGVPVG
jgi:hypothetical protein